MKLSPRFRRGSSQRLAERGYILITLILFVALLAISLTVLLPEVARQVKRDREEEMIHRGVQYSRAIKHYVKKFGRYPTRIEDLENTNNLRFLRKRYKDPITGKDFKILHMGDVQLGLMGGVGAMPGNPAAAVAAQSGAFGNSAFGGNNSGFGGNNSAFGGNSAFGNSSFGGANSSFGGNNSAFGGNNTFGGNNSAFGGNSTFGGNSNFGSNSPTGNTSNAFGASFGSNSAQTPGTDATQNAAGSPADQTNPGMPGSQPVSGQPGSPQQGGATSAQGNPVIGGGPMVGVASTSKDKTIRVFNKKEHYNEWQFIYDPTTDRGGLLMTPNQPGLQSVVAGTQMQNPTGAQGVIQGGMQNSFGSQNSPFGSQQSSSFGSQPSSFGFPRGQPGGMQPNQPQSTQPQQPDFPPDQGP